MIYSLKQEKDKLIEEMYEKAMKELDDFYFLGWKHNLPQVIILKNRKEINEFYGRKTEGWLVAFAEKNRIFILDRKKYSKESSHKYSYEEYSCLLKHELGHLFFGHLSRGKTVPAWLNEGTQLFVAGQLKTKKQVKKFSNFIEHHNKWGERVYQESGFAVELLVKKFSKEKLIRLIKGLREIHSEKEFNKLFKKIYKFDLNYKNMNKLLKKLK